MNLWSAAQAAAADRYTIDTLGIDSAILIERAALCVARVLTSRPHAIAGRVVALAGPGNNGADALAVVRILGGWGLDVVAVLATEHRNAAASQQLAWAHACGVEVCSASEFAWDSPAAAWVDGLLGTGSRGAPRGLVASVLGKVSAAPGWKLSIDIPSGIDVDSGAAYPGAFKADVTVTFGRSKPGLHISPGLHHAAEVIVAEIGLRGDAEVDDAYSLTSSRTVRTLLERPSAPAHKGQRGHVGVLAGSDDTPGAAVLTAAAAMRSVAGLCTVFTTSQMTRDALLAKLPEVMFVAHAPIPGNALVVGPGLTTPRDPDELRALFRDDPRPAVWDASGLDVLGPGAPPAGPRVLTPHPGEAARLMSRCQPSESWTSARVQAQRVVVARTLSAAMGCVVVLKGEGSLVAEPSGMLHIATSGTQVLATAGSGDVLAGLLGALLGRGLEASLAAQAGVHIHGLAGRIAAGHRAHGVVASDLIEALGVALAQCLDADAPLCMPTVVQG